MTTAFKSPCSDPPVETIVTWEGVCKAVVYLAIPIQIGLVQRIQTVTHAKAPVPFVHALGELFQYMDALNDAKLLCFEE